MRNIYLLLVMVCGSFGTIAAQDLSYENLIERLAEDFPTPGIAVGVLQNNLFTEYTKGYLNLESEKEITRETQFNVASISKILTAMAIMQLVERGEVVLDQPINTYLQRWQIYSDKFDVDEITVRRVLNHTAGLSREFGPGFNSSDSLVSLIDVFTGKSEKRKPLEIVYAPGSGSLYSNMGYGLLQMLIEDVSGLSFDGFISKNIFAPLGMSQSTFVDPLKLDDKTNLATPYNHVLQPQEQERFVVVAAAGLLSTLNDLEKLMLEQTKIQRLLTRKSYDKMLAGLTDGYGLGHMFVIDGSRIAFTGHSGLGMGWNAAYWFIPNSSNGIIVLTNGDNGFYIHQTLTCYWYHTTTGERIKSCNAPINKKLNRVSLFLEIAAEMGAIEQSTFDILTASIMEMRNHLSDGDIEFFKNQWNASKIEIYKQLKDKNISLEEVPKQLKVLLNGESIKSAMNKCFRSVDYWIEMPWFNIR